MMKNFELYNPTRILFGQGQIGSLKQYIPTNARILFVYGGGSIFKNGVYEQVSAALANHHVEQFGGVEANPHYETLIKAVDLIRERSLDFLLAVGGGSVIDGVKFISAAVNFEGDPREILKKRISIRSNAMPYGTVLTLPATASEMNASSVITIKETQEKLPFGGPALFPQFSICDPTVIKSLPRRQLQNGVVDAFMHVMEQYATRPVGGYLQDRFAEGILQTLLEVGPEVVENPTDYTLASNFMWACTLANNGWINKGVPTDWSTHMIAHELTAYYGIDHARTLAIVAPALYRVLFEEKKAKLAQLGRRIWGIQDENDTEAANATLQELQALFNTLEMENQLKELSVDLNDLADTIVQRFESRGWSNLGEDGIVTLDKVRAIVQTLY